MDFPPSQTKSISAIILFSSTLSLLGSSFIILSLVYFNKLKFHAFPESSILLTSLHYSDSSYSDSCSCYPSAILYPAQYRFNPNPRARRKKKKIPNNQNILLKPPFRLWVQFKYSWTILSAIKYYNVKFKGSRSLSFTRSIHPTLSLSHSSFF